MFSFLAITNPEDVARVESKTVISTNNVLDTIPIPKSGFKENKEVNLKNMKSSLLGNWISPHDLQEELNKRLPGCMKGYLFILN
jgi:phosphoenolpyruvate carboxykinase (GTP)